jgi:hypothetical protein
MANPNLLDNGVRLQILSEINGEENKQRKAESLKRFEILSGRQSKYITEKLESEFSIKTVSEMRKITSVNISDRVIEEQASIYRDEPERFFANASEDVAMHIRKIYKEAKANVKLKKSNKIFKSNGQSIVQIVPVDGKIAMRAFWPHHVDVIPDELNPEKPFCYIISVFDKFRFIHNNSNGQSPANVSKTLSTSGPYSDGRNQMIGDGDDYEKSLQRYEVWTEELNFIMNGLGEIVSETTDNPIMALPFVDVSIDKDFEFWVRAINNVFDFTVDQAAMLCDIATIIKLQGYAQGIISAEEMPTNLTVGPNKLLFLQLDGNKTVQPKFEFVSPSPDLASTLQFYDNLMRVFLTSIGADPKTVSGSLDAKSYSSGVERLIAMIEKFEASKDDIDLYRWAEEKVFDLFRKWSNAYQGSGLLDESLSGPIIGDDVEINVKFKEPQAIQTQSELEDSVIKLKSEGLMTLQMSLMRIYGVDADMADKMIDALNNENKVLMPQNLIAAAPEKENDSEKDEAEVNG